MWLRNWMKTLLALTLSTRINWPTMSFLAKWCLRETEQIQSWLLKTQCYWLWRQQWLKLNSKAPETRKPSMHRRHRTGQLQHFHDARSDLRILADVAGQRFPEIDSFHHSRQGSVPLDHLPHGSFGVPGKFPISNGRRIERHSQSTGVHRWSTGAHGHSWKTLTSPGPSAGTTTQKSSQNQPGEMRIWKQGSLLPGLHANSRRNQTRQEQTQGYQGRQTAHRHLNDTLIRGAVQLLQDAHQGFRSNCSTTIQADKKGLWLQIRTTSRESPESFLHITETAHFWTSHGLS